MSKTPNRNRALRRRMVLEQMEIRLPLAADVGHNPSMPGDVNNDQSVTASDALSIINLLAREAGEGETMDTDSVDASIHELFYDVNDDGRASASDAIRVINQLSTEDDSADDSELDEVVGGVDGDSDDPLENEGTEDSESRSVEVPSPELSSRNDSDSSLDSEESTDDDRSNGSSNGDDSSSDDSDDDTSDSSDGGSDAGDDGESDAGSDGGSDG